MVSVPPARALRGCHDGRGVLMLSNSGSAARVGAGNIGRSESRGICRHNSGTERLAGDLRSEIAELRRAMAPSVPQSMPL